MLFYKLRKKHFISLIDIDYTLYLSYFQYIFLFFQKKYIIFNFKTKKARKEANLLMRLF